MKLEFTPLLESDLDMLWDWLQRPQVKTVWPSPATLSELRDEYLPSNTYGAARPFIVHIDDRPLAFVQFYVVSEGGTDWWPDEPPVGAVGLDMFLASHDRLNQGLGTKIVNHFARKLFADPEVTQVRVDPRPDNPAALRCFERAGFRAVEAFTSPDGPAVLMVLDRAGAGL